MATEQTAPSATSQPWFARLGNSGKLMAIGGVVGIIVSFLPLVSTTVVMHGPNGANPFGIQGGAAPQALNFNTSTTVKVVDNWRGQVGLAGYLAALVLAFVLYPPDGLKHKALCWVALGIGAVVVGLAAWLLVLAMNGGNINLMGMGSFTQSVGIGAYLNVLAGAAVAEGAFLKARQEKLI